MVVNISQVNDYLLCPRLWWSRWVKRRGHPPGSPDGPDALDDGILWHAVAAGAEALPLDAPLWMVRSHEELRAWTSSHRDVHILGNEIELRTPFRNHTLVGRLDRLVTWGGKTWHWQHKTLAPSVPLHVFKRLIARSFHEHAYQHLVCQTAGLSPSDYGGTILAIARKLSDRRCLAENPFSVEYLPLEDHAARMEDLGAIIDQMAAWIPEDPVFAYPRQMTATAMALIQLPPKPKGPPPQNPNACGGPYRNHLCQYIDACDGRVNLDAYPELDPFSSYSSVPDAS